MKNDRSSDSRTRFSRLLRLESLEDRQLLSVNPLDVCVAGATAELVAYDNVSNVIIDNIEFATAPAIEGDVAEATYPLSFSETAVANQYTMSWDAIEGAESYNVKISRDGGEKWATYYRSDSSADPTATSCTIKGVYVGDSYSYRVFGVNERGKLFGSALEGTFAPITITASPQTYTAGETISIAIGGSDDASVSINWYYVTADGDVEIDEAAGLLEYTPSSADYAIKVVAEGTGASSGSNSEAIIYAEGTLATSYDAETRLLTLDWNDVADAAIYRVLISRNGGETWLTYAKPTESNVTVDGVYAGRSYSFRVEAYNNAAKIGAASALVGSASRTFAPVKITASPQTYTAGETISIAISCSDDASASINWYYVTPDGDAPISEATGLFEYAPSSADYALKVVVTGTDASEGSFSEAIISANGTLATSYDAETRLLTLDWNDVAGAAIYRVLISRDGGETWIASAKPTASYVTVAGVYAGRSYSFRVEAYNNASKIGAPSALVGSASGTFAPVKITSTHKTYRAGDAITIDINESADASGDINWYYVTADGDVEIPEATGLFEYTPSVADHALKVVVTGTGVSEGSSSEATILVDRELYMNYSAEEQGMLIWWDEVADAEVYRVLVSRDGGETWIAHARTSERGQWINRIEVGGSYSFRVKAYSDWSDTSNATLVGYASGTFAPAPASPVIDRVFVSNRESGVDAWNDYCCCHVYWDDVYGARSYTLEQYDSSLEEWRTIDSTYSSSYEVSELTPGESYKFRVKASSLFVSSEYTEFTVDIPVIEFGGQGARDGYFVPGKQINVAITPWNVWDWTSAAYNWYTTDGSDYNRIGNSETISNLPVADRLGCIVNWTNNSFAYEVEAYLDRHPIETPSAVVTTSVDVVNKYDGMISLREAFEFIENGSVTERTITFDDAVNDVSLNAAIALDGAGETITVDGGGDVTLSAHRSLFRISDSNGASALVLQNLAIADTIDAFNVDGANAALTLTNVSSTDNRSSELAKGVVTATGGATLTIDRLLSRNDGSTTTGAIVYVDGANVVVANSLFTENAGYYSPAVAILNSNQRNTEIYNLTIADNSAYYNASGKKGAGLYLDKASGATVYNMVFSNNMNVSLNEYCDYVAYGNFAVPATMNNYSSNGSFVVEYSGAFRCSMLLAPPTFNADYTPAADSSTIDAGTYYYYGEYDLAGNPRVSGDRVDVGAYEYQPASSAALLDEAFADYFADEFDV